VRTFQRDIVRQKTANYFLDILPVLATFFGCPFDLADLVVTNFTWQVIEAHQAKVNSVATSQVWGFNPDLICV